MPPLAVQQSLFCTQVLSHQQPKVRFCLPQNASQGCALQSLAQVVVSVSNLALLHGAVVAEAEINPLLVQANGVLALDGVVILDNN